MNSTIVAKALEKLNSCYLANQLSNARHVATHHPHHERSCATLIHVIGDDRQAALLTRRRHLSRALTIADAAITDSDTLHEGLVTLLTWMWLIDDLVDADPRCKDAVLPAATAAWRFGERYLAEEALDRALSGAGVVLRRLLEHFGALRSRLPRALVALNQQLVDSWLTSCDFDRAPTHSWRAYMRFRGVNGGMAIPIVWSAAEISTRELSSCDRQELAKMAEIGALANDLVGYDKDLEERVTTAVTVMQGIRRAQGLADDICTTMLELVDYHDELLVWMARKLERGAGACFIGGVRATWAVVLLHQRYQDVYEPETLHRALEWAKSARVRPKSCPRVRTVTELLILGAA